MYEKTRRRFEQAKASENREQINRTFDSFYRKYHNDNISYLSNKARSRFGNLVDDDMIKDCVNDIYFNMLIMDENQLSKMDETDLIKIFRSICSGPAIIGALLQQIRYAQHVDIEDVE